MDRTSPRQQYNDDEDIEQNNTPRRQQQLRFENEKDDIERARERPSVDTSVGLAKQPTRQSPDTPGAKSILSGAKVKDLDPAAERLAENMAPLSEASFYTLMGIVPPTETRGELKGVPNGLFTNMVKHARWTNQKYRAFAIAVYIFLVLQLIIGAVFIILGSIRTIDAHLPIAVLGAVSTVVAGSLALMQGQGLPNRLRQVRDNMRMAIFAAEELYWDVQAGRPVLYKDVKKIREDYLRVLEEEIENRPDMWKSAAKDIEEGISDRVGPHTKR